MNQEKQGDLVIAIVDLTTTPADRGRALDLLRAQAARVEAMDGNRAFAAYFDPEREGVIRIMHEWDGVEALTGYLESTTFAELAKELRPMGLTPPVSRRFGLIGS